MWYAVAFIGILWGVQQVLKAIVGPYVPLKPGMENQGYESDLDRAWRRVEENIAEEERKKNG